MRGNLTAKLQATREVLQPVGSEQTALGSELEMRESQLWLFFKPEIASKSTITPPRISTSPSRDIEITLAVLNVLELKCWTYCI